MKNVLLIVDPQNDFITGTLAVEGVEEIIKVAKLYKNE
jgi:nicotinamidase-related amidase